MRRIFWLLPLLLIGCGYHLVGSGDGGGAVPQDVTTLSLQAQGPVAADMLPLLRRRISRARTTYRLVDNNTVVAVDTHARLFLQDVTEHFVPSAYDATGVAVQYQMTLTGTLQLYRKGETIWNSGPINASGSVYVSGGPASIEASRQQLEGQLQREWVRQAWGRLRSGF